jgi:hypothetical protein
MARNIRVRRPGLNDAALAPPGHDRRSWSHDGDVTALGRHAKQSTLASMRTRV